MHSNFSRDFGETEQRLLHHLLYASPFMHLRIFVVEIDNMTQKQKSYQNSFIKLVPYYSFATLFSLSPM
jgi:hypothetical protein